MATRHALSAPPSQLRELTAVPTPGSQPSLIESKESRNENILSLCMFLAIVGPVGPWRAQREPQGSELVQDQSGQCSSCTREMCSLPPGALYRIQVCFLLGGPGHTSRWVFPFSQTTGGGGGEPALGFPISLILDSLCVCVHVSVSPSPLVPRV